MRVGAGGLLLLLRTLKRKSLSSTSTSISSAFSSNLIPMNIALGPNLPDVWTPRTTSTIDTAITSKTLGEGQTARIIDGKSMARDVRLQIAAEICKMKTSIGRSPRLAVVLVGERQDSQTYIGFKLKACDEVGIESSITELPEDCTEEEILNVVSRLNKNPLVHGIIVQLPLPQHLDEEKVVNFVSPEKDVDGFHPLNMGNLAMRGREPLFIPCASKACIELLLRSGVDISGKKAVVIGRSKIVGLPTSLLLQRHHATVSNIHSFTKNPEHITCGADIVVSDVGIPNIVRGNWLKPGAFVIDMGTSLVKDPRSRNGYRVIGDVCFEEAIKVVSAITPVPGGIGPLTISMLLANTLDSAKRAFAFA